MTTTTSKRMQLLMTGGVFDTQGGRPSGYFDKLARVLEAGLPGAAVRIVNGGTYEQLARELDDVRDLTHLVWFADVPNDLPKLLPLLKARHPALVLVSSKNNRKGLYDRSALLARMQAARSEFLVEFAEGADGLLEARVLTAQATVALERCSDVAQVGACLANEFYRLAALRMPLAKVAHPTRDALSFTERDFATETEIPLASHPGAFGVVRANHVHEGVDLYGQPGDTVFAMEAGVVVARRAFTGTAAGSPWWGDTECVLVEGASGVLNYGEVAPRANLEPGTRVEAGEPLGTLVTVLLKDKGRPRTMLHLERYVAGTREPVREWPLGAEQPPALRDPSALLLQAARGVRT